MLTISPHQLRTLSSPQLYALDFQAINCALCHPISCAYFHLISYVNNNSGHGNRRSMLKERICCICTAVTVGMKMYSLLSGIARRSFDFTFLSLLLFYCLLPLLLLSCPIFGWWPILLTFFFFYKILQYFS